MVLSLRRRSNFAMLPFHSHVSSFRPISAKFARHLSESTIFELPGDHAERFLKLFSGHLGAILGSWSGHLEILEIPKWCSRLGAVQI